MRSKVLLGVGCLLLVLLAGQFWMADRLLVDRFEALERRTAVTDLERVREAIAADLRHLGSLASDWAEWDDSYAYVAERSPAYEASNLVESVFTDTGLDLLMILDLDGQPVWGRAYDRGVGGYVPVPESLLAKTGPGGALVHGPEAAEPLAGVTAVAGRPLLLVSHPIRTSNGAGPTRGALVMGRWLGLPTLAETVHLVLRLEDGAAPAAADALAGAAPSIDSDAGESLAGYLPLPELFGPPSLVVRADMPRELYRYGRASAQLLAGAILAVGVLFAVLVLWLLERLVLARMARLDHAVKALGEDSAAAADLRLPGNDELARFAETLAARVRELTDTRAALAHENAALKEAQERLRLAGKVFECSAEGIMVTDLNERILRVNRGFQTITGYAREEVVGRTPRLLSSGRHGRAFYREMWRRLRAGGQWQGEIWNRRSDGVIYPQWLTLCTVVDESGEPSHYVGMFTDISARKSAEERVLYLANHDALTGLPNRRLLLDRLDRVLRNARRTGSPAALLCIDLDFFKNVNDSLGHEVGDRLLCQVANALGGGLREADTLARVGGDEFVVVVADVADSDAAARVAKKLLASLNQAFAVGEYSLSVSASIGIAMFPEDGSGPEALLRNADAALYGAKAYGRGTFAFFIHDMNRRASERLTLESALRRALERRELALHFQPQVVLEDQGVAAVEALLRWTHPDLGSVAPARFVPVAEETGLILALGEWVLDEACRLHGQWRERFPGLRLSVNISPVQFRQEGLAAMVESVLSRHGTPAQALELEITEGVLLGGGERVLKIVSELRELGLAVALDDFGTGYSGLGYLRRFDIDTLKVDRSFVAALDRPGEERGIVSALVAMAHNLNLEVVAEGVETAKQLEAVCMLGCERAQGYYFAKPMPPEQVTELLAAPPWRVQPARAMTENPPA